jgi:invasion protein IalB
MPRLPFRTAALAAALALSAGAAAAQDTSGQAAVQGQQAELVETATHGDWKIVCLNGEPPCVMRQTGRAEGQDVMEVSVRRIEPQQTQQGTVEAVMDIRVPLGVLLREGVSIRIDQGEAQRGAYSICVPDGCLMREPLPNAFVNLLKAGAVANVGVAIMRNGQAQELAVPVSLSGFTAAFNSLEP